MKNVLIALTILGALMFLGAPAVADWAEGDDFKMHYPQLPDPDGWDVNITRPNVVADDFECTQPGPIRDIHFWFSVERDQWDVALAGLESLRVSIRRDIPVSPDVPYSRPGELLWDRIFGVDEIIIPDNLWTGDQGWADPAKVPPVWRRPDHNVFFQANIVDIKDPFIQKGTTTNPIVYWLDLGVKMRDDAGITYPPIGWKTTFPEKRPGAGWNDDAVYWGPNAAGVMGWQELWEWGDQGTRSLDMAFVITPEPGTVAMLLGVGLLGLVAVVRRRRK